MKDPKKVLEEAAAQDTASKKKLLAELMKLGMSRETSAHAVLKFTFSCLFGAGALGGLGIAETMAEVRRLLDHVEEKITGQGGN